MTTTKIKLTRATGTGKPGDTIEVTTAGARKLIELGAAEDAKAKPAPKRTVKAKSDESPED